MRETALEAGVTLKYGIVDKIDPKTCRVIVRLPDYDNLRTAWLPVMQGKTLRDKHYHLPDVGEHVAVLLDLRCEDGMVIGAIYSTADPTPVASVDKHHIRFDDGGFLEYDRSSGRLKGNVVGDVELTVGGSVDVTAGGPVTVTAPSIILNGAVTVNGPLTQGGGSGGGNAQFNADVLVPNGDVTVGSIDFGTHTHPGDSGGTTGGPQ